MTASGSTRFLVEVPSRKVLLLCGILSSLLYVVINIVVPMQYPGYNPASQTISELSAIGAPTRRLWVILVTVYLLLLAAFGYGVWKSAAQNRPLRIVGGLLLSQGILGLFCPPMHQREVVAAGGGTLTDTMHIVFGTLTILLMLLTIGFGALAFGTRFRRFSIVSIAIFLGFAVLTGLDSPRMAANLATPWLGIWERSLIGVFLFWVIFMASTLLRSERTQGFHNGIVTRR
jgi:hypothetical protein